MWRELTNRISNYLGSLGLEPLYIINLIAAIIIFFSAKEKIKKWDYLQDDRKSLFVVQIIALGIVTIVSILHYFDVL